MCSILASHNLQGKYLGFERTYMHEILVASPLCTSKRAGVCRFSVNLWKRALDVTADVIVEATRNTDILTINASENFQIKCSKQYEWLRNAQWRKAKWSHVKTAHSITTILNAMLMTPVKLSTGSQYRIQRSAMPKEALVYMLLQIIDCKGQNAISR